MKTKHRERATEVGRGSVHQLSQKMHIYKRRHEAGRSAEFIERFGLSAHAQRRAHQRGLSMADIRATLRFGERFHAGNAVIYYLRATDIPTGQLEQLERLEGTAVIAAKERPQIITVWRNRQRGMRNIKRKLAAVWRAEEQSAG